MNIKLEFDFDTYTVSVPDGYISNVAKMQIEFLEWMHEQPECISQDKKGRLGFSYSADTVLKYINDVILCESNEKAYFVQKPTQKASYTLKY